MKDAVIFILILLSAYLSKADNCYYHITFNTLQNEDKTEWKNDTIVFEFDLKDSILSIKNDLTVKDFNILAVSFNDYELKDNVIVDIYKLSEEYYLCVNKKPKTLDILQLILFDGLNKYFIYK